MMNRSLLCALMLTLAATPAAAANLVKTYSYFSVGGRTLDDIEKQLTKNGPEVKSTGS
ncbi:MAG: peptidase, partial [Mesorhizobium sp.]